MIDRRSLYESHLEYFANIRYIFTVLDSYELQRQRNSLGFRKSSYIICCLVNERITSRRFFLDHSKLRGQIRTGLRNYRNSKTMDIRGTDTNASLPC